RGGRRQILAVGQPGNVGDVRSGARGHQIVGGLDAPAVDLQRGAVDEARVTGDDLEAVLLGEVEVLLPAQALDDLALAGNQRGEVDRPGTGVDDGEAVLARAVARLCGGQK